MVTRPQGKRKAMKPAIKAVIESAIKPPPFSHGAPRRRGGDHGENCAVLDVWWFVRRMCASQRRIRCDRSRNSRCRYPGFRSIRNAGISMAVVIRKARGGDADALALLNADVQVIHAAALPWLFKSPGPHTSARAAVADILEHPDNFVLIAEVDGAAAGYAYGQIIRRPETPFQHAHDMVYLHHISVRPAHRRNGVGSALIGALRAAANADGVALVTLDVWTFNDAARAFFRRHGFVACSERMWTR
jgi:ribosomal protein S18 acetylase RimI-like enzyme